jgi:hypothetical protein
VNDNASEELDRVGSTSAAKVASTIGAECQFATGPESVSVLRHAALTESRR